LSHFLVFDHCLLPSLVVAMGICGAIVNLKALSPKRQAGDIVTVTGWPKPDLCHSQSKVCGGGREKRSAIIL
jgi:hypothetical protein